MRKRTAPALLKSLTASVLLSLSPLSPSFAAIPDWAYQARIANLEVSVESDDQEIDTLIAQRKAEKVSVLEIDSGLSIYLTQAEFDAQVALLQSIAGKAHAQGLKAVIYITSLEVNTKNGETLPNSMFKDHPDWVQRGFNNTPAVFYGSQEDWVEPGEESAWMSPNSGYRSYFINRVKQLAASGLDGVWMDVPVYREITISNWGGLEPGALTAFNAWSIAQGFGGATGYSAPGAINWNDPVFRAWITWRHDNLAQFVEEVRQEALAVNPNFLVITEVFPVDDMDATATGLDKAWSKSDDNHFSVWEIDSVSFTQGMKWSSIEEYRNKIAMYKWARAIDRSNPSWAFSYGNEEKDAGLVMGTAVAAGVAPFESKTPGMTSTVSSAHRQRWFGFIGDHKQALLQTPRQSKVAVWYSSASRDFHDFKVGGAYGMYGETTSPNNDPDWWADSLASSIFIKPHLGGYRGASNALIKLHIPYKVVADPGEPALQLDGVKFLWLPSVTAISDASATAIKNFVQNGGTVFATGEVPGTLDEYGNARSESVFKDLFNLASGTPESRAKIHVGSGVAIYRPDIKGREFFAANIGTQLADENLTDLEQLVRIHADDDIIVDAIEGVHIEVADVSASKKYVYVLNYSGLKQPLVSNLQNVAIQYRAPAGYRIASATAYSPDGSADTGSLSVNKTANQWYRINPKVDQFTLIELNLAVETTPPLPAWPVPSWPDTERQEAARSGLDFILNNMRHLDKPLPYTHGVYTNLLDTGGLTEIYAHGHHVSAEHMGLTLRTSACMGDQAAWQQSYQFVRDVMADPMYHVVNWAVDRDRLAPLVDFDDGWLNANAPLDDFRVIRGLMDGHQAFNQPEADRLGETLLTGMLRTSVTDQGYTPAPQFPGFPNGLVGYAWNWLGTTDLTLTPAAIASSVGLFSVDPIPVDYNDLFMMAEAARRDPRWLVVLQSATNMLLDSEIPGTPGLFYNGYEANGNWTGDFENRDINQGRHFKTIQGLWIALHLARAAQFSDDLLPASTRQQAQQAASRSLDFFKNFYQSQARIPEYFSFGGEDIPNCTADNVPDGCLIYSEENLFHGEARIYAQLARLALLLDDPGFAATMINNHILTDRISDPTDPRYGQIGPSTASADDAEAWNVLESVLTLCEEAIYQGSGNSNQPPVANTQTVATAFDTPANITLGATDADQDVLSYTVVTPPAHGTLSGTAPNLNYTPDTGYTGNDSFSFKANDGQADSATVTVTISIEAASSHSVSNPVSDTAITIDAHLGDWVALQSFGQDDNDITHAQAQLDWLEGWFAHDADSLYIAYRNDGTINTGSWWAWEIFMDTDDNASTGYQTGGLGVEYVLDGKELWQYTGTGTDWSWQHVGSGIGQAQQDRAEIQLNRSLLGNPGDIRLAFFGQNGAFTGDYSAAGIDWYPNGAANEAAAVRYFSYRLDATSANQAPVAQAQSVTTQQETAKNVLLSASDADNDPLSYAIVTPPAHGTLSGTVPNLTYTPDTGYTGNDSFSFKANDGQVDSTTAVVTISVEANGGGNVVSNPVSADGIAIDADLGDWSGLQSFGQDGDDISLVQAQLDWLEGWMAHDVDKLYLAYRNDGVINTTHWQAWEIFMDTDNNATSGYQIGSLGVEYVLDGKDLWQYTGTGSDWSWQYVGSGNGLAQQDRAEIQLDRSLLGNPNSMRLVFFGQNSLFTGSYSDAGVDVYPNTLYSQPDGYFSYDFTTTP